MRIYWFFIFCFFILFKLPGQIPNFRLETTYSGCDTTGSIRIIPLDASKVYSYLLEVNDCSLAPRPLQDSGIFLGLSPCRYTVKVFDDQGDSSVFENVKLGLQMTAFLAFTCDSLQPQTYYRLFSFKNGSPPYILRAKKGEDWVPGVFVITRDSSVAVFDTLRDKTIVYHVTDSCGDTDFIPNPLAIRTPILDRAVACDDSQVLSFPLSKDQVNWTELDVGFQWKMDGRVISDSASVEISRPLQKSTVIVRIFKEGCFTNYFHEIEVQPTNIISLRLNSHKTILCQGDSTSINATTDPSRPIRFQWSTGDTLPSIRVHASGVYSVIAKNNSGCSDTARITIDDSDIKLKAVLTQNNCFAEARANIDLAITGGIPPYQYNWIDNIHTEDRENLPNGKYKVRVIDSIQCATQDSFQITSPSAILLMLTATAADCAAAKNGKVITSVQGGIAPYNYQWNNGLTVPNIDTLTPGSYTISVRDSHQCSVSFSFVINELAPFLSLRYDTICAGSELQVGTSQYNQTGRFLDTLRTTKGCDSLVTTFLTVNAPVDFTILAQSPSCDGKNDGKLTITNPIGLPGFLYFVNEKPLANAQLTGLSPGNFVIKVRDRLGCFKEKGIALSKPEPIQISLGKDTTIQFGDSLLLKANTSLSPANIKSFQWTTSPSQGNCINCGQTYRYLPNADHVIKAVLESIAGCKVEDEILVTLNRDFKVFVPNIFNPASSNPENQYLSVKGGNSIAQVRYFRIFNRYGDQLFEAQDYLPNDSSQGWDGRFRNADAASGVYIYVAEVVFADGTERRVMGDFVLLR